MNKKHATPVDLDTIHFKLPSDQYEAFERLLDAKGQKPSPELVQLMHQQPPWEAERE